MEGPAGDLRDDVGPVFALGLRSHPWRYALLVATIVAGVIAGAELFNQIRSMARCVRSPTEARA